MSNPIPFKSRINQIINEHKSVANVSRVTGISESAIKNWRDGKSDPTRKNLLVLAEKLNVDLLWLMTGGVGINEVSEIQEPSSKYEVSNYGRVNEEKFYQVIQGFNENQEALSTTKLEDQIADIIKTYNLLQGLPEQQHEDTIKLHAVRLDIRHMEIHKDMTESLLTSNPGTAETLKPLIKDIEDRLESLKNKAAILTDRIRH